MANEEDYFIPLPGTADSIRVRRTTERGQTLAFTVQYEPWVDGAHRPAVRYDTAHGFAHRDILDWDGVAVKDRGSGLGRRGLAIRPSVRPGARLHPRHVGARAGGIPPEEAMSTAATGETMTITDEQRRLIAQNFILHQQFAQAMLTDAALVAEVPHGALLVLLPDEDAALREANIQTGLDAIHRGQNVYFRRVYRQAVPPDRFGGVVYGPYPPSGQDAPH